MKNKKINIYFIFLIVLAVIISIAVITRDFKSSKLSSEIKYKKDTVYLTKTVVIHDTIYLKDEPIELLSDKEIFFNLVDSTLNAELKPLYEKYNVITKDNINDCKALYDECVKSAESKAKLLKEEYIEGHKEEADEISEFINKSIIKVTKPYLKMLSNYGKKK